MKLIEKTSRKLHDSPLDDNEKEMLDQFFLG